MKSFYYVVCEFYKGESYEQFESFEKADNYIKNNSESMKEKGCKTIGLYCAEYELIKNKKTKIYLNKNDNMEDFITLTIMKGWHVIRANNLKQFELYERGLNFFKKGYAHCIKYQYGQGKIHKVALFNFKTMYEKYLNDF